MKKLLIILMAFLIVGLAAALASAQTVTNPTKIEYTVSPDHATLTKYVVGYFLPAAAEPVQQADLPVSTPNAEQRVEQPLPSLPVGYGTYVAKMRAVAGAVSSEWSFPSNEWMRAPLPPTAPTVKR